MNHLSFSDRARRISAEALHSRADAQSYLFDNPRHIGVAEIELTAAEHDLEAALRMVRGLRTSIEQGRETINLQAAE